MTGWRHRTQVVIIFRQFQKSVQPIFESWRNRKRGTLYARTRKAPALPENSRNVPTITGNVLRETVFRLWRQFLKNAERDFCSVILRKLTAYMRPVPFVPSFDRIFIYGSHQKRLATYCNLRQVIGKLAIGSATSCQVNAK